ncbi:putative glucosylceramidase 3 [Hyalella azteca]|uniref:Glucosylceramidase n=1 Tax=Hyalella azteca TaxID=294128 RepID=A0A8B7NHZ6_HYAAZ|nr:putative glucosylceramidase 3 [Hyalella azteca]
MKPTYLSTIFVGISAYTDRLVPEAAVLLPAVSGQCVQRQFEYESFVCVCDATFCDEVGVVAPPAAGTYSVYTSSRDQFRLEPSFGSVEDAPSGTASIAVSTASRYQSMIGFGGAFTDSTGLNFNKLPAQAQEFAIRAYFAPEGIGYNIGRIPIAGSDCSTRPYSYDDHEGDIALELWALEPEDYDYKFPYLKRALEISPREIFYFGSPWAPPAWMKTNGMFNGSGILLPEMWQPWSDYIVKFVEAYEAEGVPIWGLTPQNEPLSGYQDWGWNTCGWNAEDMRDWIKLNLGPTLEAAGLRRLKMMIDDFNRDTLPDYVIPSLEDPDSNKYVDGVAVHWYSDTGVGPQVLDQAHEVDPSKFLLYTEACEGYNVEGALSVMLGSWTRGEHYFDNIIEDLNHWSGGWVDWNMALDITGGPNWANNLLDSPIIVNEATGEFYKQPTFYAMAHASKFIERDGVRVDAIPDNGGLRSTAVINPDGTIVVLVLNKDDASYDISIAIDGTRYVNANLPAKSMQTFLVAAA